MRSSFPTTKLTSSLRESLLTASNQPQQRQWYLICHHIRVLRPFFRHINYPCTIDIIGAADQPPPGQVTGFGDQDQLAELPSQRLAGNLFQYREHPCTFLEILYPIPGAVNL